MLIYLNQDNDSERHKAERCYLQKGVIKKKNVCCQPIDSDIKLYKEIRKLITRQDEDCTAGCLLDYE